jgi:hypothetical protein
MGQFPKRMSSCQNKWILVKGNDFMSEETFTLKLNEILTKEIISFQRKLISVKGYKFLSKEMN